MYHKRHNLIWFINSNNLFNYLIKFKKVSKGLDTLTVISKLSKFTEPSEFIQNLKQ